MLRTIGGVVAGFEAKWPILPNRQVDDMVPRGRNRTSISRAAVSGKPEGEVPRNPGLCPVKLRRVWNPVALAATGKSVSPII
jgi:hypothetical protein